jgi:hypothetical protein
MATPSDIEVLRTQEYRLAVGFQLNERAGKLSSLVGSMGTYSDKKVQVEDQFDDLTAQEKVTRNGDTQNVDISAVRRWLAKPRTQNVAPLLDRDDLISTKIDVKSPIAIQTAKAVRRAQDDRWLQGFYGNALTGEDGATVVPFKAANIVAVNQDEGANAGITLNKLIYLSALMDARFSDEDEEDGERYAIITSKQKKDLLKLIQVQSKDYNPQQIMALQNAKVLPFMGFTFITAEIGNANAYPLGAALTVDGNGYRRVPFFKKSGLHKGTWTDFYGRITERDDKQFSTQIYAETCAAVTRTNEDKCFQMLCLES